MYKDDNGEWVTDLAYQHPLRNSFENLLKDRCSNVDPSFTSFASNSDEFVLNDSEFKSGSKTLMEILVVIISFVHIFIFPCGLYDSHDCVKFIIDLIPWVFGE